MRTFVLMGIVAVGIAAMSQSAAVAQARDDGRATAGDAKGGAPGDETAKDAQPKRNISEEGGMKASGPSQAKGGESR